MQETLIKKWWNISICYIAAMTGIDTSEHVIKSGLLRKVLDKLGIEITYKWWEIALDAPHPIINNKRYDHKDLSK